VDGISGTKNVTLIYLKGFQTRVNGLDFVHAKASRLRQLWLPFMIAVAPLAS
jgi:hypothetical protein